MLSDLGSPEEEDVKTQCLVDAFVSFEKLYEGKFVGRAQDTVI